MAYKIAIIDDEVHIRNSIRKKIEIPSFEVVYDTDDGNQLIDYLKQNGASCLDLLLVDIIMPQMNGLDLIREIKSINPEMMVVILSGYSNFEYAQKAIQLGIENYILKPIMPEDLNNTLSIIKEKLDHRNRNKLKASVDDIANYAVNKGIGDIEHRALTVFMEYFPNGFRTKLCLLGNWNSSYSWFEKYNKDSWSFIYPGIPNLLVSFTDSSEQNGIPCGINCSTVTTFLSIKHHSINNLVKSIEDGLNVIRQKMVLEKNIFVDEQLSKKSPDGNYAQWKSMFNEELNIISKCISSKEYTKVIQRVEKAFTCSGIPQICLEDSWRVIAAKIYEYHPEKTEVLDQNWLKEFDDTVSFRDGIVDFLEQVFDLHNDVRRNKAGKDVVMDIVAYIKSNYSQNITLKDIADQFYINRSHLTRIFKQVTNKTFNEFLTDVRINKACRLIIEGRYNIKDISYMVGYEDHRYFSQVFQKVTGCIPSKYKERVS